MGDDNPKIPFRQEINFEYGRPNQVAPAVRRLVANNPGPFTYKGTNCYIVGEGQVAVIDPGPDDQTHIEAILNATKNETISHIILTHTHRDHSASIPTLKSLTGATTYAFAPVTVNRGNATESPSDSEFVDGLFAPDETVTEGALIEGPNWSLRALHTPGHAPDHLCFDFLGQDILFSGDHVMSWNTSVIAPPEGKMSDYLRSLEKLLPFNHSLFFPGHGGRVEHPQRVVKAFLLHRRWREAAILETIKQGNVTVSEIVKKVYKDIDPEMTGAASFSVLAHAEHLIERGKLSCAGPFSLSASFSPV